MQVILFFSMRTMRFLFCYDQNNNTGQWFTTFSNIDMEMNGVPYGMIGLNSMGSIHTGLPATSIFDTNLQNWENRIKSIKIAFGSADD